MAGQGGVCVCGCVVFGLVGDERGERRGACFACCSCFDCTACVRCLSTVCMLLRCAYVHIHLNTYNARFSVFVSGPSVPCVVTLPTGPSAPFSTGSLSDPPPPDKTPFPPPPKNGAVFSCCAAGAPAAKGRGSVLQAVRPPVRPPPFVPVA